MELDNKSNLHLTESVVQCFYFLSNDKPDKYWNELKENLNAFITSIAVEYLWHKDNYKVFRPILDNSNTGYPPHLASYTCFGDNIEDEWFIVYIVLEISKKFKDLIIQIQDDDGEFLLVEAADYLPKWANPDNTENRVFIQNGKILIIPPKVVNDDNQININNAIHYVANRDVIYINEIQEAILKRVGNYPDKIKDMLHNSAVYLPIEIAALLQMDASLISHIVHAYCNFDVIDAKSCQNLNFDNCVKVKVKFTKCLYAMLTHAKLLKNNKYAMRVDTNNKPMLIGLKLACGYQMIMRRNNTDVFSSREYQKFLNKLGEIGYFKDNLEGSKDYKQLLKTANEYYINMECPISLHINNEILSKSNTEEFIKIKESLSAQDQNVEGDNDDWLNIDSEQLNQLLTSRYDTNDRFRSNDVITNETITAELSKFLKKPSDFEGIETNEDVSNNVIDFDAGEFSDVLKKMANFIFSDEKEYKDDSDLSISDEDTNISDDIEDEIKLNLEGDDRTSIGIKQHLTQSLKEEGPCGPTSNLLMNIGIKKTDILDSDDDE